MAIPILVICYNNYKYVKNFIKQIKEINFEHYKNIQIIDNVSTCLETKEFLKGVDVKVVYNHTNGGPRISPIHNSHIYTILPETFILSDPDLKLNSKMPSNFVDIMLELSNKYKTNKIGFALDISDFNKMYQAPFLYNKTIYQWERSFWKKKLSDPHYELYEADIDTTFCLINKNYLNKKSVRIAGNFTVKHLPWYIDNEVFNVYENYLLNSKTTIISTFASHIISHIHKNFVKIYKNKEFFLIDADPKNTNLPFWKDIYSNWEKDMFEIFDKYLSPDKIFIDIGGWIGTTAMYGSRKSKHVYVVEADSKSYDDLKVNLKTNCKNNYTLIHNAIYDIDDTTFYKETDTPVKTITLERIIKQYEISPSDISLIKVDIEGGEEHILSDLIDFRNKYNVPLCIRFQYNRWSHKNLDRFSFLTSQLKDTIKASSTVSLLF